MKIRVVLLLLSAIISVSCAQTRDQSTLKPEMVFVEGGTFQMGSNDGAAEDRPAHQVTVNSFLMAKIEVTFGSFEEFIEATNYRTEADTNGWSHIWTGVSWVQKSGVNWRCNPKGEKRGAGEKNHPVIHVSWNDAVAYCNWLSEKEGLQKAYSGSGENTTCDFTSNGYRLPTEAEWEYAAGGGVKSTGFTYSGSNNLGEVGWYGAYDNSGNRNINEGTSEAGMKLPNELGIYDMSGNVWEWCWDRWGNYNSTDETNPRGPSSGSFRVSRGGSWFYTGEYCRVTRRHGIKQGSGYINVGFRLARTKK